MSRDLKVLTLVWFWHYSKATVVSSHSPALPVTTTGHDGRVRPGPTCRVASPRAGNYSTRGLRPDGIKGRVPDYVSVTYLKETTRFLCM